MLLKNWKNEMKIEKQLINKYNEFFKVLAKARFTFKNKDDVTECNRILKEILILNKGLTKINYPKIIDSSQTMFKFKKQK